MELAAASVWTWKQIGKIEMLKSIDNKFKEDW